VISSCAWQSTKTCDCSTRTPHGPEYHCHDHVLVVRQKRVGLNQFILNICRVSKVCLQYTQIYRIHTSNTSSYVFLSLSMFFSHFLRKFEYARLASAVLWSSSFFAYLRVVRLCVWKDIDECEHDGLALPKTTSQCGHLPCGVNVRKAVRL